MLVFSPLWAGDLNVTFDDLNDIKHENYPSGSSRKSYYLDNCYKLGQDCSTKTAADAWCREYMDFPGGGYPNGDVIPVPSGEKSFTMGDKQSCSKDCRTYQSVTCVATNPTTFREPKYRGFRLDTTEKPNGVVDEAVADQYCQKMGFGGRFDSLSRGGGGKPTKRIGDDVLCLSSCGAFDYITCGTFKVTAPTAKKVLETGSTLNITWLSDKSAPVSLELYKGGHFTKLLPLK